MYLNRAGCCCDATPSEKKIRICVDCLRCETEEYKFWYSGPFDVLQTDEDCLGAFETRICDPDGIPESGDEYEYIWYLDWPAPQYTKPLCSPLCSVEIGDDIPSVCYPDWQFALYQGEKHYICSRGGQASLCWEYEYVDSTNITGSCTWKWDDGGTLVNAGTISYTQVRYRYNNPTEPGVEFTTTGDRCAWSDYYLSSNPALQQNIDVYFAERATYLNDRNIFRVYGSSATYANWTIEITATQCVIRDGSGVTQYTYLLSSYTMIGLANAINALTELITVNAFGSVNLQNSTASGIPAQGPYTVTDLAATAPNIYLRKAGDPFEDYQTCGKAFYQFQSNTPVTEDNFSGTLSEFRSGMDLDFASYGPVFTPIDPCVAQQSVSEPTWECDDSPSYVVVPCVDPDFSGGSGGFDIPYSPIGTGARDEQISYASVYYAPQFVGCGFFPEPGRISCGYENFSTAYRQRESWTLTRFV